MEIHNLTSEQVQMLDTIWAFETLEQIDSFKKGLPRYIRQQVDTLMEMIRLQTLDDMVDEYDLGDYPDARTFLEKIKNSR